MGVRQHSGLSTCWPPDLAADMPLAAYWVCIHCAQQACIRQLHMAPTKHCCATLGPAVQSRRQAAVLKARLGRNIELNEYEMVSPVQLAV